MTQWKVKTMVEVVREAIIDAMREARGNKDHAAYLLNIGRTTLYRKLHELEIRPEEWQRVRAAEF